MTYKSVVAICTADKASTVQTDIRGDYEEDGQTVRGPGPNWVFSVPLSATASKPATHLGLHTYMTHDQCQALIDHPDCQVVSYDTTDEDGIALERRAHFDAALSVWGLKQIVTEAP